ncbi:MAG: hypothetical protein ABJB98_01295 [Actinomycetota bacterium]
MLWVVAIGWGFAIILAAVVLGCCGYEVAWKSRRLRGDLFGLQSMRGELNQLQAQLAQAQRHVAARRDAN